MIGKNKFIRLLSVLPTKETKRFKDFIDSPYFNKNQNLSTLFQYIQKYAPSYEHPKFNQEGAFNFLFPDKTYKEDTITKLLSKMFKLFEQYLILESRENNNIANYIPLLRYYNEHAQGKYFDSSFLQIEKELKKHPYRNADYYFNHYQLELNKASNNTFYSNVYTSNVKGMNFLEVSESLDIYYYLNRLSLFCDMINHQRTVKVDYNLSMIDETISVINKVEHLQQPAIQTWYFALQLLKEPSSADFFYGLKDQLKQHSSLFTKVEARKFYTYLENTLRGIIRDQKSYYKELFELYRLQLEEGILYDRALIPAIFRNIVVVAVRLNEFDWAESFIGEYKNKMLKEYREETANICLAFLYFEQRRYEDALEILNEQIYTNFYFKIDARRIRLKIYYELEFKDSFDDLVNSFRKFLSENKQYIPAVHLKANRDFINFAAKLSKLVYGNAGRNQKFKTELAEMPPQMLPEKNWLLEKVEKL